MRSRRKSVRRIVHLKKKANSLYRCSSKRSIANRYCRPATRAPRLHDHQPFYYCKALNYGRERRVALELFLTDPDVPIDTNQPERASRVVPMGRQSWLFNWAELGAKHVGIIQSLIVTCKKITRHRSVHLPRR